MSVKHSIFSLLVVLFVFSASVNAVNAEPGFLDAPLITTERVSDDAYYQDVIVPARNSGMLTDDQRLFMKRYEAAHNLIINHNPNDRAPHRDNRSDPDDSDYEWRDNDEDDGPEFEWLDRGDFDGVREFSLADDENTGAVELGWTFPFWDREFSNVYMDSDGWISFTYGGDDYELPVSSYPREAAPDAVNGNTIAIFQADNYDGTEVWFWTNEENIAVIWWAGNHRYNFQLILHLNGLAVMQYGEDIGGNTGLVGVNLGDGDHGWYISGENAQYTHDGRAIGFGGEAAWAVPELELSVDPEVLQFGAVRIDNEAALSCEVTNNSDENLTITEIESDMCDIFSPVFEEEIELEPDESFELEIVYTPARDLVYQGVINISDGEGEFEFLVTGTGSSAQGHYDYYNSGINHSILVTELTLGDVDAGMFDEIAVFTTDGICAGSRMIEDPEDQIGLPAFGDDGDTENVIEGFVNNEEIHFRVWDYSQQREYTEDDQNTPLEVEIVNGSLEWRNQTLTRVRISVNDVFSITPIEPVVEYEGEWVSFQFRLSNPPVDDMVLEFLNEDVLPSGECSFNARTGYFEWETDFDCANPLDDDGNLIPYELEFRAFDPDDEDVFDGLTVMVTILNTNRLPIVNPDFFEFDEQNERFFLTLQEDEGWVEFDLYEMFIDPDEDDMYFIAPQPDPPDVIEYEVDNENGVWRIKTADNYFGTITCEIIGRDDMGGRDLNARMLRSISSNVMGPIPQRDISSEFDLVVEPDNDLPVIEQPTDADEFNTEIIETNELVVEFGASDVDNEPDELTWEMVDQGEMPDPEENNWNLVDNEDGTAVFTWTPGFEDEGNYNPVFRVSDGVEDSFDDLVVNIDVRNLNQEPVLSEIGNQEVDIFEELTFTLETEDPDGDDIEYTLISDNLPDTPEFEDGVFTWTPAYDEYAEYVVTFRATDNGEPQLFDEETITITVNYVNAAPVLREIGACETDEREYLIISLTGSDANHEDLTFTVENAPEGAEVRPTRFVWRPNWDQAGEYEITVRVIDNGDQHACDEEVVAITVHNTNRPPEVENAIEDFEVEENPDPAHVEIVNLDDVFIDPDTGEDEELEFSFESAHEELNMGIDDQNVLFVEPAYNFNLPDGVAITVTATDINEGTETDVFIVVVVPVNSVPEWVTVFDEPVEVDENAELVLDLEAMDPEEDEITIELVNRGEMPDAAEFTDNGDGTGTLNWETTYDDEGEYNIVFTASDAELTAELEVAIIVLHVNQQPVVANAIDDIEIDEDDELLEVADLNEVFEDPDGDELTFTIIEGIDELNLQIDEETHILTLVPAENYNGDSEVVIEADDGQDAEQIVISTSFISRDDQNQRVLRQVGNFINPSPKRDLTVEDGFAVTVNPVNDAPEWVDIPLDNVVGVVTFMISFDVEASDIEDNDLTIELSDRGRLPDEAELEDHGDGTATFNWQTTFDDAGEYITVFSVSDGEYSVDHRLLIVIADTTPFELEILEGWSMISLNISPVDDYYVEDEESGPNIVLMFEQLRINENNHRVIRIKNEEGRFYTPAWGYNGIPYWNIFQGYQIKVTEDCEAVWGGVPILADTDIPIQAGWNNIAYFPSYTLPADRASDYYAFSPIIDNIIQVKNGYGDFMVPAWGYSNMRPCVPGMGFQILVDEDVNLEYPEPLDEGDAMIVSGEFDNAERHWLTTIRTNQNMSVLVNAVEGLDVTDGSQIAAFNQSSGRMVGVGTISDGVCGLAVWGDDYSTEAVDGMTKEDKFDLRLWDTNSETEMALTPVIFHQGKSLSYLKDALLVLDVEVSVIPDEFYLSRNYPNPFNATTRLSYGLPDASQVSIHIYDIAGRLVETLISSEQTAGHHAVVWDGMNVTSGVYLVKMETANFRSVRKVMLVK
ncbi:MAG: Ig-like domain-containing protein [Candidatus Hatepunaea meridiana]|nr:Ig-like domain-containing protein [Candidatus Hatepunaea meridiana]